MATVTERLAVIVSGDASGAVSALHRTGREAAEADHSATRLTATIERLGGRTGPLVIGAAAALGPLGAVGAALAGTTTLFAGLGIAAAHSDERVTKAFSHLRDAVVEDTTRMAAPIAPVLADVARRAESTFRDLEPVIGDAMAAVAPQIQTVADGVLGLAREVLPALSRAAQAAGPLVQALSDGVVAVGHGLAGFIDAVSAGAPGAAEGLKSLLSDVALLLPPLGRLIGSIANAIGPVIEDLTPTFQTVGIVISAAASVIDHVGGVLNAVAGPATKAAIAVGGIVLAVKGLQAARTGFTALATTVSSLAQRLDATALRTKALLSLEGGALRVNSAGQKAVGAYSRLGSTVRTVGAALPILGVGLAVVGTRLEANAQRSQQATERYRDLFLAVQQGGEAGRDAARQLADAEQFIRKTGGLFNGKEFAEGRRAAEEYQRSLSQTDRAQQAVTRAQNDLTAAIAQFGQESPQAADAADTYQRALGRQRDLEDQVADATQTSIDKLKAKADLLLAQSNSEVAYQRSQLDTQTAVTDVATAQDAYNKAVARFGQDSAAAKQAAADLARARLDERDAVNAQIAAAGQYALDSLPATATEQDKARAVTQAQAREYDRLAAKLSPGDPLRARLLAYSRQLRDVPSAVSTTITARLDAAKLAEIDQRLNILARTRVVDFVANVTGGLAHHAGGGAVSAGVPVVVGEDRPEIFIPSTSGTIRSSVAGQPQEQGRQQTITVNMTSTANPFAVAREVAWQLRTAGV